MAQLTPDELNERFGIPRHLSFFTGAGGFVFARLETHEATAEVCLHGGHVTSFIPRGAEPVLWLSPDAAYVPGKAIRGGIPVCWPWFADHPEDPARPAHGIARTADWGVFEDSEPIPGIVRLELSLPPDTAPDLVDPGFDLHLAITLSSTLSLSLTTTNLSDRDFSMTAALHTYLNVGDVAAVRIEGLDGIRYHDKLDGYAEKRQSGDLGIHSAVDRIYENTGNNILVHDPSLHRTLGVVKSGSSSTVIWNPGEEGAKKMSDMPDDGYRTMVCVEAANAGEDVITLAPGDRHVLGTVVGLA